MCTAWPFKTVPRMNPECSVFTRVEGVKEFAKSQIRLIPKIGSRPFHQQQPSGISSFQEPPSNGDFKCARVAMPLEQAETAELWVMRLGSSLYEAFDCVQISELKFICGPTYGRTPGCQEKTKATAHANMENREMQKLHTEDIVCRWVADHLFFVVRVEVYRMGNDLKDEQALSARASYCKRGLGS